MWKLVNGIILLGIAIWLYRVYGGELIWYAKFYHTDYQARRFYAESEHLVRNIAFHPQMEPCLDVYSPATGQNYPVLLFVHGGGWNSYNKALFAPVAMKLLPEKMVVVIPDYTLYPEAGYEQMAHEVAAAISWTLENITYYRGHPRRVIVAGHSAGGHLAGLAVMDPRFLTTYGHSSREICGLIEMSGVYDVQAQYEFEQARGNEAPIMLGVMGGQDNFTLASPSSYIRSDLPPMLVIHGDQDETVPLAIATNFQAALQAVGAKSELKVYQETGHTDFLFEAVVKKRTQLVADFANFCWGQQAVTLIEDIEGIEDIEDIIEDIGEEG